MPPSTADGTLGDRPRRAGRDVRAAAGVSTQRLSSPERVSFRSGTPASRCTSGSMLILEGPAPTYDELTAHMES